VTDLIFVLAAIVIAANGYGSGRALSPEFNRVADADGCCWPNTPVASSNYTAATNTSHSHPSSPVTTGFTGVAGIPLLSLWTGARYSFTSDLDAGVAYYHYDQNSYGMTFCNNISAGTWAGTLDAISLNVVDWQFAKKFDVYAGMMYSAVHNGLVISV
jgi:hypothetical protein